MSEDEYEEFLFWSGQIPNLPLDNGPELEYNTPMENEKFNDNLEISGDLHDEYLAQQEAEAGVEPEMASDEEIKDLLMELWDELLPPEEEDTEREAFNDYISNQHDEFN